MGVLLFLLVPVLVVGIGSTLMARRQRKPSGMHASIDSFRREMDALSPDSKPRPRG
jgi:hypothetical protein